MQEEDSTPLTQAESLCVWPCMRFESFPVFSFLFVLLSPPPATVLHQLSHHNSANALIWSIPSILLLPLYQLLVPLFSSLMALLSIFTHLMWAPHNCMTHRFCYVENLTDCSSLIDCSTSLGCIGMFSWVDLRLYSYSLLNGKYSITELYSIAWLILQPCLWQHWPRWPGHRLHRN